MAAEILPPQSFLPCTEILFNGSVAIEIHFVVGNGLRLFDIVFLPSQRRRSSLADVIISPNQDKNCLG